MTCPKCGSTNTLDSTRLEQCHDCGWFQYYGDAHAPAGSWAAGSHSSDDPDEVPGPDGY